MRSNKNTTTTSLTCLSVKTDTNNKMQNYDSIRISQNNQEPSTIDKDYNKFVTSKTSFTDKSQSCSDAMVPPFKSQQDESRQLFQGSGSVLPSLPGSGSPCAADENVSCSRKPPSFKSSSMASRAASSSSERSTSQDRIGSTGYAGDDEFVNSEFYIDESLPSSGTSAHERFQNQLQMQQSEIKQSIIDTLSKCHPTGSFDEETVILLLQVLFNIYLVRNYFFVLN